MLCSSYTPRAGIDTLVLEKHADFFRDFRGDTVHPSTLNMFWELGLLERFLQRPHQKLPALSAVIENQTFKVVDFSHLPGHAHYIVLMPQWDFLDFIRDVAEESPHFTLRTEANVQDLLWDGERVVGVKGLHKGEEFTVKADLVVACDGRHSIIREQAQLPLQDFGAPIDVLWMRISRQPDDPQQTFGLFNHGNAFVMLNRDDYWQCGRLIYKGNFESIKVLGLPAFQKQFLETAPFLQDRVQELHSWEDIRA